MIAEFPLSLYFDEPPADLRTLSLSRGEDDFRTVYEVYPLLFRYINSFWWFHLEELKRRKDDDEKIEALLNWLERQMTRDDIRL